MLVKDVTNYLESIAPLSLQESYDNSGLIVGDNESKVSGVLLSLDVTFEVIEEAINQNCNLIIAHHPLVFTGIKKITNNNWVSNCLIKAIKNDVNIYALHTNLDNVIEGVNGKIADMIGLKNRKVILQKKNLNKLSVFTPKSHKEKVLESLLNNGAGHIGNYSNCSFSSEGLGTFTPLKGAKPFTGEINKLEQEDEVKLEVIVPKFSLEKVVDAMKLAHPFEEIAYDIIELKNESNYGSGIIGDLEKSVDPIDFLKEIKNIFDVGCLKHTSIIKSSIKKVAVCGGSGSFLLSKVIRQKADIFISSDFKYHQFFDADGRILIADIGHYESEQYTIELISDLLMKKFTNFAIRLTKINTNPINYL